MEWVSQWYQNHSHNLHLLVTVRLLISYCCAIFCFCTILNFVDVVHNVKPKSCSRSYVHFCVPWILGDLSNDPGTGTANDFHCCLH